MSIRTTIGWSIMRMGRLIAGQDIPKPNSFDTALEQFRKKIYRRDNVEFFELCLTFIDGYDSGKTLSEVLPYGEIDRRHRVYEKMLPFVTTETHCMFILNRLSPDRGELIKALREKLAKIIAKEIAEKSRAAKKFEDHALIYDRLSKDHLVGLPGLASQRNATFRSMTETATTLEQVVRASCTLHTRARGVPSVQYHGIGEDENAKTMIKQHQDRWDELALKAIATAKDYQSCANLKRLLRDPASTDVGQAWYARMAELHPSVEAEEAAAAV